MLLMSRSASNRSLEVGLVSNSFIDSMMEQVGHVTSKGREGVHYLELDAVAAFVRE